MFPVSFRVLILIFFSPLFLISQNLQGEGFVNENNNRLFVSDSLKAPNTFQYKASRSPIILDYNFVDFPFSEKSIELSGFGGLFANPSMSQSLNISSSFYSATREGFYRLKSKNKSPSRFNKFSLGAMDFLTYLPIPLSTGWMHEEFHRSVLAKYRIFAVNQFHQPNVFIP